MSYSTREPKPPMSVEEVLEMVPDQNSWVNDGLRAYVVDIEPGTGKPPKNQKFWKCELGSESGSSARIAMTLFRAPRFKTWDLIDIVGQGIKRKEFNGKDEVSTSDKTEFHVITSGNTRRPANPPPAREPQNDDRGGGQPPPKPADTPPPPADGLYPVPGQTVGMVMKEAIALLLEVNRGSERPLTIADLEEVEFYRHVHRIASNLARISNKLIRGDLARFPGAPAPEPQQQPPPPAKTEPPRREPEPQAQEERHTPPTYRRPPPAPVLDEDVPF